MDRARVAFRDAERPDRSGSLALDEDGQILLHASGGLAAALDAALGNPRADVGPLHFEPPARGLALAGALAKGVRADRLECELMAGALEVRAYLGGRRVRLTLKPGDFDPDAAWEFLVATNDAQLEAARI